MTAPIIEMPNLRSRLVKLRDWVLTGLWWIFWLYLIREIFVIALTVIAERSDAERMATVRDITSTFGFYFQVIVINGLILILWARYNRFRFRGKDRRSAKSAVTAEEIAEGLEMTLLQVQTAQRARRMVVHHDEGGLIQEIEVAPGDTLTGMTIAPTRQTAASGAAATAAAASRARALRETLSGGTAATAALAPLPPADDAPTRVSQPFARRDEQTRVSRPLREPIDHEPVDDEVTTISERAPPAAPEDTPTTVSKPQPGDGSDNRRG
jgi:biofilm PGA synthesis protein PgaD